MRPYLFKEGEMRPGQSSRIGTRILLGGIAATAVIIALGEHIILALFVAALFFAGGCFVYVFVEDFNERH